MHCLRYNMIFRVPNGFSNAQPKRKKNLDFLRALLGFLEQFQANTFQCFHCRVPSPYPRQISAYLKLLLVRLSSILSPSGSHTYFPLGSRVRLNNFARQAAQKTVFFSLFPGKKPELHSSPEKKYRPVAFSTGGFLFIPECISLSPGLPSLQLSSLSTRPACSVLSKPNRRQSATTGRSFPPQGLPFTVDSQYT